MAVTSRQMSSSRVVLWLGGRIRFIAVFVIAIALVPYANAAVLPEDRGELLYHSYEGGGVTVDGPALLVRKGFAEKVSVSASYYRDVISGASPDVLLGGSEYSETRDEYGVAVDYLFGNSLMSLGYTNSEESDYEATSVALGVSHEVFGGLTTISMGYARGADTVSRSNGSTFGPDDVTEADIDRHQYQVGLSQVLTKTLIANFSYEAIADEGFLNNPYRRIILEGALDDERYPGTRTSQAFSINAKKHWQNRSSSHLGYRYFTDTWEIDAHTIDLGYTRYFGDRWLADIYYRHYDQTSASFFSNNFDQELNFMARDKELSSFNSNTLGFKLTYKLFNEAQRGGFQNGNMSFAYERSKYDYDNYSEVTSIANINDNPYSFDADIFQFYFSVNY